MLRILLLAAAGLAGYVFVLLPWHRRWGATDDETRRVLPGDVLLPTPDQKTIRDNPTPDKDGRISAIDANKCGPYMAANHGCGICIAVCPFSMAGYQKIEAGFKRKHHNPKLTDAVDDSMQS